MEEPKRIWWARPRKLCALERPGEAPKVARLSFEVRPRFSAPGYGDAAPRSHSLTEADAGGIVHEHESVGRALRSSPYVPRTTA